eukprot:Nitzschia sp. Nitz4//NODE_491_length_15690_cov_71.798657//8893//10386//NITZ4_additional_000074-RA//-1//CDS//3329531950//8260//frame0
MMIQEANKPGKLPVTLLSGFLGSGKTTLLQHMLTNAAGKKFAIVVNDMATINIDAALVKTATFLENADAEGDEKKEDELVELSNGCICCTLRDDLIEELKKLTAKGQYDGVVIEASGIAEPLQTAEAFFMEQASGPILNEYAQLDTLVTVVDASTFNSDIIGMSDTIERRELSGDSGEDAPEDNQAIAQLLCEQIEFANVILVNKTDTLSGGAEGPEMSRIMAMLRTLNKTAKIVATTHARVGLDEVIDTGLFKREWAESMGDWMKDVITGVAHTPETLEYNMGSFVYRSSMPFHPLRFFAFLTAHFDLEQLGDVEPSFDIDSDNPETQREFAELQNQSLGGTLFRAKGYAWIGAPCRFDHFYVLQLAGQRVRLSSGGTWDTYFAAEASSRAKKEGKELQEEELTSHVLASRSQQEIVFIGQALDEVTLSAALDRCLLTSAELCELVRAAAVSPDTQPFPDPFMRYSEEEEDDEEGGEEEDSEPPRKKHLAGDACHH